MSKRLLFAALLALLLAPPLRADFSAVARAIDHHDGVHRVWIPFLGVARAMVWMAQPKGLHDFQLVTFTNDRKVDPAELREILREKAGPGFKPLVQVWSRRSGEWTFIYAKATPDNHRIDLMVLTQSEDETVLVRVEVDADVVAREIETHPRNVTRMAEK